VRAPLGEIEARNRHAVPARPRVRSGISFLMVIGGLFTALTGCGNVSFVDAPYAPRKIEIIYSQQEDITLIRWRMAADTTSTAVSFDLLRDGAWQPIDFATSVFAGGVAKCGDGAGTCAQLVLDGPYELPPGPTMLRAHSPDLDPAPGDAPQVASFEKLLMLQAFFKTGNQTLDVMLVDNVGGDPVFQFPRPIEGAIFERRGVCVPGFPPTTAAFAPLAGGLTSPQQWTAPATLSADGRYCASIRGVRTSGQPGIDEPQPLDTLPETSAGNHRYSPPTEITPFSYQIVVDLSIPVADRCQEAISAIESAVASSIGGLTPVRMLPTIDLTTQPDPLTGQPGTPCLQSPTRALDAVAVAQAIKVAAQSWHEQHQRAFLLYFNNLRAPLPDTLMASFDVFAATMQAPPPMGDLTAQIWAFGPPEMLSSYGAFGQQMEWLSPFDANLAVAIGRMYSPQLPLISEVEDPTQPIAILSDADAQQFDGGLIRMCQVTVSPPLPGYGVVSPVAHDAASGRLYELPQPVLQWPVKASDPPAYLVTLPTIWAVPKPSYQPDSVRIQWEICTRYCDHAFTSDTGQYVAAGWLNSTICMGKGGGA
jgi:hypothetical protein